MKVIIKDILFGILIFVVIMLAELLVSLPFDEAGVETFTNEELKPHLNREFLLTAIPAVIITFFAAWFLKTDSRASAVRRSIIWTLIAVILYLIMGIGNDNLNVLFGVAGMYVLLLAIFAGPLLFAGIKHLK